METKEKRKINWIKPIKVVAFLVVLVFVINATFRLVTSPNDYRSFQRVYEFYKQPKNTMDVVFVGSSVTYSEVNPMVLWNMSGIAGWDYATNSQPFEMAEYVLREGIKRQPNALYVVTLNSIHSELGKSALHWLSDYMPLSQNKIDMIDHYAVLRKERLEWLHERGTTDKWLEDDDESLRWEFIFPPLVYHSRWDKLNRNDFHYKNDGVKSAPYNYPYLMEREDLTDKWVSNSDLEALPERTEEALDRLLTLIDEENIRVLFVVFPRAEGSDLLYSRYNTLSNKLTDLGYDVLDLRNGMEEMGLDIKCDYYNVKHTNIHGAIKITSYITNYLQEHYDFTDKRNDPAYQDWTKAADKYFAVTSPYYLDLELDVAHRDHDLPAPKITDPELEDDAVIITWEAVSGADGYRIYRRDKNPDRVKDDIVGEELELKYDLSSWTQMTETDPDTRVFVDRDLKDGHKYFYTVVPYKLKDDELYFGKFDYLGVSIDLES